MHTQEKRVALTTNSKLILQAKRQNQQHAEEVTSCSLTYFCNSTGSKIDTWKTRGPVFMPVLPVKDHSPTMGLDRSSSDSIGNALKRILCKKTFYEICITAAIMFCSSKGLISHPNVD